MLVFWANNFGKHILSSSGWVAGVKILLKKSKIHKIIMKIFSAPKSMKIFMLREVLIVFSQNVRPIKVQIWMIRLFARHILLKTSPSVLAVIVVLRLDPSDQVSILLVNIVTIFSWRLTIMTSIIIVTMLIIIINLQFFLSTKGGDVPHIWTDSKDRFLTQSVIITMIIITPAQCSPLARQSRWWRGWSGNRGSNSPSWTMMMWLRKVAWK